MNAKHSLCMSKRLLLILGAVLCAQSLQGQDAWHEGRNVAGLAGAEASEKPSQATLFGKFTSGDFRNWSQGKTLWSAGATASSEIQLKDMVMVGSFGFTQEYGTQMMGSMFTNPGYYLVDVVEFTPGSKSRQTYNLDGGIAWKNGGRWIPGFTAHFQGINYAKRKDLRHTTYRQELEVVPSVLYQGEGWRIGASYIFEKNSEFIQAEQVGPARADSYYALLDKGMRYGAYQAWDGSGIHLAEPGVDRFPVQETAHGGSLQFSLGEGLYADAELVFRNGVVGEKGYTWFRSPSVEWAARMVYTYMENGHRHNFHLGYEWSSARLYENVVDKVSEGGITTPVILGTNRIFAVKTFALNATYALESASGLQLEAGLFLDRDNKLSTLMYPYMDLDGGTHLFFNMDVTAPLGQHWQLKAGILTGGGAYSEQISEAVHEDMSVNSVPYRLTDWWDLEQEVDDALRVQFSLALRYSFTRLPLYLEGGCSYLRALEHSLVPGVYRQTSYLQLGYNF